MHLNTPQTSAPNGHRLVEEITVNKTVMKDRNLIVQVFKRRSDKEDCFTVFNRSRKL